MHNEPAGTITRRRFLAAAAGTALGLPLLSTRARAASPNEKIVVAHVGVGSMGTGHVSWFAGEPDVETAAVCDVDSARAEVALAHLKRIRPDTKAVVETDFRRLLERKDIDVISCATPDHWHALVAILAFQAGKHVYGEKPLSYDMGEAQTMLHTRERYNRVFQLGTQIHATENYHRIVELLRSGAIGKVHTVRLWSAGGNPNVGFPPDSEPPPTLDWNMWLGPAPWRRFNPVIHPHGFRHFWDFSGGTFADIWCHIADLPFWALDLGEPKTVVATGEDPLDHVVTTPANIDAEVDFGDVRVIWESKLPDVRGADAGAGRLIHFAGDRGELTCDYDKRTLYIDGKELNDIPEVPKTLPRSPGHVRNFLDCVKSGGTPESNISHAYRLTLPMYMGCIAYRLGRKLQWDSTKKEFVNDDAANRMRHRPYRAPWDRVQGSGDRG